jgi:ABC-type antimicrobial peptide transport system permease subunit
VAHVPHWGLAGDDYSRVRDQIYYPFAQVPDHLIHYFSSFMSVAVRTRIAPQDVVQPLRQELRGAAGDQTLFEVRTMEELASGSLARQSFLVLLFGIFAGLALLLACVGVYGVMAYLTGQRVPEIGVRMTLGATTRDVMRMVLGQSVVMIAAGTGIGVIGALAAGRLLHRMVEGMRPMDASTLATTTGVLVVAALLASFIAARRASRVDPVSALRQQ